VLVRRIRGAHDDMTDRWRSLRFGPMPFSTVWVPAAPRVRAARLDVEVLLAVVPANSRRGRVDNSHAVLTDLTYPWHEEHGVGMVLFDAWVRFIPGGCMMRCRFCFGCSPGAGTDAARNYQQALDQLTQEAGLAA
jgi:hypothetical protein